MGWTGGGRNFHYQHSNNTLTHKKSAIYDRGAEDDIEEACHGASRKRRYCCQSDSALLVLAIAPASGRIFSAPIQADRRGAPCTEDGHFVATQVLGEVSQRLACPAGRAYLHARSVVHVLLRGGYPLLSQSLLYYIPLCRRVYFDVNRNLCQ